MLLAVAEWSDGNMNLDDVAKFDAAVDAAPVLVDDAQLEEAAAVGPDDRHESRPIPRRSIERGALPIMVDDGDDPRSSPQKLVQQRRKRILPRLSARHRRRQRRMQDEGRRHEHGDRLTVDDDLQ
jgi:hypothetical protein